MKDGGSGLLVLQRAEEVLLLEVRPRAIFSACLEEMNSTAATCGIASISLLRASLISLLLGVLEEEDLERDLVANVLGLRAGRLEHRDEHADQQHGDRDRHDRGDRGAALRRRAR